MEPIKAKILDARVVMYEKPGSTHYVGFLFKGDLVWITDGYSYEDRPWNPKYFVKVKDTKGREGFIASSAISLVKEAKS